MCASYIWTYWYVFWIFFDRFVQRRALIWAEVLRRLTRGYVWHRVAFIAIVNWWLIDAISTNATTATCWKDVASSDSASQRTCSSAVSSLTEDWCLRPTSWEHGSKWGGMRLDWWDCSFAQSLLILKILIELLISQLFKSSLIFDQVCPHLTLKSNLVTNIIDWQILLFIKSGKQILGHLFSRQNSQENFDLSFRWKLSYFNSNFFWIKQDLLIDIEFHALKNLIVAQFIWFLRCYMELDVVRRIGLLNDIEKKLQITVKNLSVYWVWICLDVNWLRLYFKCVILI